jgi:hypothetical protein
MLLRTVYVLKKGKHFANHSQLISDEETFGPVAALIKFSSEEEVIVRSLSKGLPSDNAGNGQQYRRWIGRLLLLREGRPYLPRGRCSRDRYGRSQHWCHLAVCHVSGT